MTAIQKAREALVAARDTLSAASRQLTDDHKIVLGGKRWGEVTSAKIDVALAALDAETPATPAYVGEEPVAFAYVRDGHLFALSPDKSVQCPDPLYSASALARVAKERDEARATLDEVCLSSRQEWQRATSAEAKLAEARKVIEPFARFQTDASGNTDDPLRQPDTQAVVRSSRSGRSVTFGDFRAARRFLEESK